MWCLVWCVEKGRIGCRARGGGEVGEMEEEGKELVWCVGCVDVV